MTFELGWLDELDCYLFSIPDLFFIHFVIDLDEGASSRLKDSSSQSLVEKPLDTLSMFQRQLSKINPNASLAALVMGFRKSSLQTSPQKSQNKERRRGG